MAPRLVFAVVFSLLLLGPVALRAQPANGAGGEPIRLRPGDAVRLEVRDEPTLSAEYPVDVEGFVLLPMVGIVSVAGRAFPDVQRDVLEAFRRELASPVIRLTPVLRIAVLGEVMRPGLIPVDPTLTLADILASAGGLTPSANRRDISLIRDGQRILTTTMDDVALARTAVLSGDQIFVGRRSWFQENVPILIGSGVSVIATLITALVLR
jgi:polysaccharide export outer membrane protein